MSRCGNLSLNSQAVLGVDGCRGGWFAAASIDGQLKFFLFSDFSSLLNSQGDARLLVDIPMGLPVDKPRSLDTKARKLLTGRASSVFPVPMRAAVYADSYQEACRVNERLTGRRLSKQSWFICPKIREVDQALRLAVPVVTQKLEINESHPELAFHLLNGGKLNHSKKTPAGHEERLSLLTRLLPDAGSLYPGAAALYKAAVDEFPRRSVARDDILDALVLLAVGLGETQILQDDVRTDEFGIPIRMLLPMSG